MVRLLGPDATLSRGYSITTTADGAIITSSEAVELGAILHTRVLHGALRSRTIEPTTEPSRSDS